MQEIAFKEIMFHCFKRNKICSIQFILYLGNTNTSTLLYKMIFFVSNLATVPSEESV